MLLRKEMIGVLLFERNKETRMSYMLDFTLISNILGGAVVVVVDAAKESSTIETEENLRVVETYDKA